MTFGITDQYTMYARATTSPYSRLVHRYSARRTFTASSRSAHFARKEWARREGRASVRAAPFDAIELELAAFWI